MATTKIEPPVEGSVPLADYLALKAQVDALQRPAGSVSTLPEHGAGVGGTIASTWSAYDQALAVRGEHPHQRGEHADWLEYQE
jgi:hypothetical protein